MSKAGLWKTITKKLLADKKLNIRTFQIENKTCVLGYQLQLQRTQRARKRRTFNLTDFADLINLPLLAFQKCKGRCF